MSAVLEHLCNEARNSAHATFGALELLRGAAPDAARQEWVLNGAASGDRLLRFIDDLRTLTAIEPPPAARRDEFDLVPCAAGIVEALNMVSRRRARHMYLDVSLESLMLTQDRGAVEEVLTRVLDTAFKLTGTSEVRLRLSENRLGSGAWSTIASRDPELARQLIRWLNTDLQQAVLAEPDVPFGIAVMVAGKRLRLLGGSAELEHDAAGHFSVALSIPSLERVTEPEGCGALGDTSPDALNVLVVEDCDESFVLTEVVLDSERVTRASNGPEAVRMIQKQRFDLVLMDIHMPGMSGYEAIRRMRAWETQAGNARTPIVILSSDDLETQRLSAAQSGCSGFLRKPLHRSELARVLDRLKQARVLID
jgi:CheY-like chemotaxis protein